MLTPPAYTMVSQILRPFSPKFFHNSRFNPAEQAAKVENIDWRISYNLYFIDPTQISGRICLKTSPAE